MMSYRRKEKTKGKKRVVDKLYKGQCDTAFILSRLLLPAIERGNQQHKIIRGSIRFHEQIFAAHLHISCRSRATLSIVIIFTIQTSNNSYYRLNQLSKKKGIFRQILFCFYWNLF
jgi:hypothetical protein